MSKINVNILIICLICLIAVGTASAADFNQSDVSVSDEVQVDLNEPLENDIGEASMDDASADVNETSQGSDVIGISNEENTLGDAGTRDALTTKINAASSGETVDLENDYTLSYSDYAISISKPITVDGHGHTINAGSSRVFTITAGSKVTLQNIKFTNCGQYGVIYLGDYGYSTYTLDLINCTFYNLNPSTGSPSYSYGAIHGTAYVNLNVTNCKFINGSGTTCYRAMYFGKKSNVNIVNSTFDDNRNNNGGAIYFAESGNKVTIANSTFEDNYAWRTYSSSYYYSSYYYGGGAIYFSGGSNVVTISNSTFKKNHVAYDGGVIYFGSSSNVVTISNSTFNENYATYNGGVIYFSSGSNVVTVSNSTFNENYAKYGGAIYLRGTNTANFTDSTFEGNYVTYTGGAIYTSGVANFNFENSTFENNHVDSTDTSYSSSTMYGGGAIYLASTANLNINGSTFKGNRASNGAGGAIYFSSASNDVNITNSDFDSNYVSYNYYNNYHYNGNGGVLYYSTGGASNKLNIINSTFESNHADYTYSTTSYAERRANGGVAYFMGACNVVVEGSTFDDNYVSHTYYASRYNKGGVFYFAAASNIKIGNSTFEGNRAVQYGGVIYLSKSSTVVISNHSTFRNNHIDYDTSSGPYGGGVLYSYEQISLNVSDSVFDSNYANSGSGGAFYLTGYDHNIVLFNSIFENNYAQTSYSSNGIGNGGAFYIKNNVASFIINKTTFERNHVYYTYTSGSSYNQNADGGAIFFGSTSTVDIINSTFDANYAQSLNSGSTAGSGGAIYFGTAPTLRIGDSYFINNNATCAGGAIYFNSVSDVNIYNTHFNNNIVSRNLRHGGAIYVASAGSGNKFDISKSTFENNHATYGGVIDIASSTALNLNIIDSTFKSDRNVSNGAVVYVSYSANIKIENAMFDNFVSTGSGSVISTSDSSTRIDLKIYNSSFTNNSVISTSSVYGGAIYLSRGGSLELVNASFINNTVRSYYVSFGGALAIKSSSAQNALTILNSTFEGNSAPNYGAIYLGGISGEVLINDSKFVNNSAESGDGYGGAMSLSSQGSTVIYNTLFENNRANRYGGAIYAYDVGNCQIINSLFNNNRASFGGAIYVSYTISSLTVDKSRFTNNRAQNMAGAIYLPDNACNAIIMETSFDKNSVFKGNGGAIYFGSYSNNTQISSSNFTDNYVQYGRGGAIFMGSLASNAHIENSLFKNNSAGCFNLSENDGVASGSYYGGAIFVASAKEQNEFINITCIDNKASDAGGAIYYYGGGAIVRDSYFTNNVAPYGSAVFLGKTNRNSNNITNSYFANNQANSTELNVVISSSSSSITVKHAGGNNYINAIYSYDENINFDNVQYFEYDAENGRMYTDNPSRQDYKAYQTIFIDVYGENDQIINTISGKTDDEGKWVIDYPNLSNIKYLKVYRLADDYYSYIEVVKLYTLGDFDILQELINALDENGVLVLDRNYTYSLGYDSIVDGIVIDKKITVDGNGYTINALDQSRIFYLAADGIKLTNIVYTKAISDSNGGAIYGVGVNGIVIEDSLFNESSAKNGGAIYLEGNDSSINNATFFYNGYKYVGFVLGRDEVGGTVHSAPYSMDMGRLEIMEMYLSGSDDLYGSSGVAPYPSYGGAVYLEGSNLKITDSNFTYNVAILGGAVFINGTDSAIENSFFNLNMAFAGGAVYAEGNNITVSDSIFVENMAEGFMFYKYYPDPVQEPEPEPGEPQVTTQQEICPRPADDELLTAPVMSRDIPEADSGESNGPRTDAPLGEEVPFTDSTALAYKEYIGGGAIHMAADNSKVINSRFVLNQNDESIGGAIYWLGKNGEVSDSHFSWNVADYGGAIYWDCEADNGLIDNCYFKHEPEDINILASAYEYYYMGNVIEQLGNYANIAHRGAAIFYDGYNGIISNSVFERNIAVEHGGAISVHGNSTTVSDCQFDNNTIGDLGISSIYSTISPYERGGSSVIWYGNDGKLVNSNFTNHNSNFTVVLWMGEDAYIYTNTMEVNLNYEQKYGNNGLIENCLFRDNHGSIDALVEWIGYNGTISNSEFYNNSAEYYGAVLWFGTDGKIIDTEFARNYGRYAAFLGIGYNTSIVRCTFDENVGILGVVYQGMELEEYNEYTFEIDEFTEYTATSKLLIEDSTFTNNYALVATVIDSSYRSKISNSRFYNNSNYHTALLIMGGESSVDGCNFTDNTGFAGSALMVGYIDVDNSYYFAGSETIGDPYSIIEQFGWDVTVSNSRFTNNTAQLGGAVSWFGLNGTMENSIFIGNGFKEYDYNALLDASENTSSLLYYGQDMEYFHNIFEEAFTAVFKQAAGGAMNWMGVNGLVNNCTFENNSASAENVAEHYGGAVCWQGDDGVIKASTFVNNFASKGGSVFWVGEWGTIANSTFSENRIPSVKTEFKYTNYTAAVYQYFDFDFEYNEYSLEEDKYAAAQAHYDEAYAYVSSSYTYDELEYIWYIASYQEAYCPKAGEGSPAYLEINYVFLLKNHLEFNATTPSFGGAVYWYGEHGLIYNSTFTNNSATQGGAVYWNGYYGGIQDSIFNENTGTSIDAIIFSRELMDPYVHTASAERNVYSEEDCEIVIKELIASEIYNVYGYIIMGIEEGEFNEFTFDVIDVSYYKGEPQVTTQQEIMVNPEYVVTGGNRLTTGEFEPDYYRFEVTFNIRLYNSTYRTGSYKSAGGAVYWNAEDLPEFNPIYPPMPNTPVDPTPGEVVSRSTNPGGNLKAVSDSRDILADDYDDNGDYYDDVVEEQQTGYQPGYIYNCTFIKNSVEEGGAVYWATPEGIIASSKFINNSASYGGAVYGNGSYLLINGSEFISNNAEYGGAVYMLGDMGLINESSFIANKATYGGAVYYGGYDNAILGSEFKLNKAKSGSAVYVASDIIYIANTTLLDNQAYYDSLFSTFVVDGNTLTVEAAFSGKDNLMNAIFVTGDFFVQNVTYWSVDGVTNSDIDVPSVSELEAGQNITLEMINVDFETTTFVAVTNINGEVGFYVPNIRGGRHIVVVSHKEDNYYTAVSRFEVIIFKTFDPELEVNVDDIYYHENATVNVKLNNEAKGNVTIYLDGVEVSVENITGGVATLNLAGLDAGKYNVEVFYPGDGLYLNGTASTTFNVFKINSTIVISTVNTTDGAEVPVNVTVGPYDDLTGNVYVTIDGIYGASLKVNGRDLQTVVRNLADGEYNITAHYVGDNNYYASTNTTSFTVEHSVAQAIVTAYSINANIADISYLENATANITVSPSLNGTVSVVVDGKTYDGEVIDGNVLVNLYGLSGGVKTATVDFTSSNGRVNLTTTTKFEVFRLPTAVDIVVSGKDVAINVTEGATGILSVYINGAKFDYSYVGETIALSNVLTIGNNTILAVYAGNENYTDSQNVTNVPISKAVPQVSVSAEDIFFGADAVIVVNVGDRQTGYITMTVNNTNYNAVIDGNQMIVFNIPGLAVANYPVEVTYSGDAVFDSASNSTDFNVIKADMSTSATVVGLNVTVLDNTVFVIGVPSNFNGFVNITVDGEKYSGAIEPVITMARLAEGKKVANVVFWGDANYENFELLAPFTVSRVFTNVTVDVGEVTYPGEATAHVTVSGMANGTVVLTVDGHAYDAVEVVNGQATVELGRFDAGIRNITADFKVTDSINTNATDDSKFAVNKAHTAVGITTENENVIISVTAGATGKVTLYVNGNKKEYTFTGDNLVWENILIVGNNTIVAIYDGNENYEGSQNTTNVIMGKKDSSVNVAAETITYGSDAVIVVSVGEGQTGFVTINVNNKEYSAEIINGGASFTIPGLNAASYPVGVRYSGDVNFTSQENSTTLTVNKADLTASVVGENVTVNENTVFVVSGVPADFNGKLNITVDGEKYSGDANALIKMAKLTAGDKVADVIFYGDANYNDLTLTAPFTVSRVSAAESGVTTMTVTVTDVTYPETATAIVSVSGSANGTVTITVNGKAYGAKEVVNGNAVVDLGSLSAGVKDLTAEFTVTDAINNDASANTKFVVEKAATSVNIATEGKDVTVTVSEGAAGDLTVYINGEKTDYAYTGEAIVISNALAIGNNTIFAVYAGNENYSGSQNTAEAFIAKNKSAVTVSAEDIEYGRDAIIIVNVGEGQTGYVTITVNDKTYSSIIDSTQMLFSIHGLAVGNYPVSVSYSGDDTFLPEVNSTSFAVTQRDMGISASVVGQDVLVTQNTSFIISVPSDFSGYVNITVDGITYSGPVSPTITMARLSDGKKVADVVFWGDKNYNDFALTAPFTVSRIETSMNVEVQDVVYLNNATAIVSVSGNANGTVAVTVGDRKYDAVDVINGYAAVELGMLPAGIKTVTAEFTVTDAFNKNATAATKFVVEKAGTAVSIRTDGYDVMVNVTEGAAGTVSVYVNGNKKEFTFDGTELIWENALIVGDNAIVAVYDGNENYEGSQNAIDANIDKLESTVSVSADDVTYDADAVIVVTVGEGQTGLVTITVAGKEYSSEIKDSGAVFIVPGLNAGEYNVTVTYSGDFNYTSQTNETVFNVRKANLTATVEGEDITVNDYSSFVINNVPSNYKGKVNITVDDEFYSGDVSSLIRMGKLTAGIKVANVVFYGDNNYNDLGLLVSFEVSRVSMSQAGITIMSVTVDDVTYPDEATAVISITGNARGMVTVTVNGVEYEPVEVIGGFALVELGQLSAGLKLLTAEFIVSDMVNNNATATTQFNVIQANSTVDIEFDGTNVIVNVNSGEPGKLHVYINGAVNELTYDGNEVVFENVLIIGDNTVLAIFDGSENYTGSQNTRNLTIPKKESTVSVSAADITYGSQAVIVVTVPVDETGYATIVVDGKNYTAFISEGKATFNVTGLKVAKYDVSVTYQGNENYTSQVNQTTFNVGKADLTAEVIGQNITTADSAAFVVSVPDDFTGKVNITVDGITYSGNVSALIKMSKLSEGAKVAKVVFWDDPNYNDLALDAPFKVSTIVSVFEITTIKADNMTRAWNSEFDYQAAFLNKDGSALANETVKFKVKGKTYTATTNEDGIAHLIGVKLDVGTYKITSINPVTGEQITNTLKIVKRITENKNIEMDYRDGTKFTVKVYGDNGTVAPKGEIISFYINGIYYVGKVDSTGHASVKIKLLPKTYTIVAEYKGFKTTNKIKVKQILKVSKKTIKVKKSVKVIKFKATLKYSNGKALKNKVITFKFKGKTYKAKTNKKGVATIKIKKKSFKKLKKGKKYKVIVAYSIKEKYGNDVVPISDRVYCYVKVSKK